MRPLKTIIAGTLALLAAAPLSAQTKAEENKKPNILFIITDDHAYQTLGTGNNDSPVALPNFNKLGRQGMVFDRSYCANSLCGPSRACILTGRHSHMNGFVFNGQRPLDGSQPTYPKMLQKAGYQTGLFGKWHLESDPTGFDTWEIFPGQGSYYNPDFINLKPDGKRQTKRFPRLCHGRGHGQIHPVAGKPGQEQALPARCGPQGSPPRLVPCSAPPGQGGHLRHDAARQLP